MPPTEHRPVLAQVTVVVGENVAHTVTAIPQTAPTPVPPPSPSMGAVPPRHRRSPGLEAGSAAEGGSSVDARVGTGEVAGGQGGRDAAGAVAGGHVCGADGVAGADVDIATTPAGTTAGTSGRTSSGDPGDGWTDVTGHEDDGDDANSDSESPNMVPVHSSDTFIRVDSQDFDDQGVVLEAELEEMLVRIPEDDDDDDVGSDCEPDENSASHDQQAESVVLQACRNRPPGATAVPYCAMMAATSLDLTRSVLGSSTPTAGVMSNVSDALEAMARAINNAAATTIAGVTPNASDDVSRIDVTERACSCSGDASAEEPNTDPCCTCSRTDCVRCMAPGKRARPDGPSANDDSGHENENGHDGNGDGGSGKRRAV